MKELRITSPVFRDNGLLPVRYTGFGEDVSPCLDLENLDDTVVSVAIILDDLDVPFMKAFTHWVIWNLPPIKRIPEHIKKGERVSMPEGAIQGDAWGKHVYRGPKQPPFLRQAHRYIFRIYGLDMKLDLEPSGDKAALQQAMEGHIIQEGTITAVYKPE